MSEPADELPDLPYIFNEKLQFTKNFIHTTKVFPEQETKGSANELPECYFAKYNSEELILISIRESSRYIKDHILNEAMSTHKIKLLNELSLEDEFIRANGLGGALVDAKFFAGI